jgi:hypothetical protein
MSIERLRGRSGNARSKANSKQKMMLITASVQIAGRIEKGYKM